MPSFYSIKINLVSTLSSDEHDVEGLSEDILTLFTPIDVNEDKQALERHNNSTNSENVHFGETVYDIEEENTNGA